MHIYICVYTDVDIIRWIVFTSFTCLFKGICIFCWVHQLTCVSFFFRPSLEAKLETGEEAPGEKIALANALTHL